MSGNGASVIILHYFILTSFDMISCIVYSIPFQCLCVYVQINFLNSFSLNFILWTSSLTYMEVVILDSHLTVYCID